MGKFPCQYAQFKINGIQTSSERWTHMQSYQLEKTKISLFTVRLWKLNVKLSLRESQLQILWSCFSLIVLRCKCKQCRVTLFIWEKKQNQRINTLAGSEASCSLSWNNITYLDMSSCWEAGEAKVLLKGHLRHFCT